MRWDQGRADAERMLAQARRHLMSAQAVCGNDPEGGYALLYDAGRKALAAVLGNEGLRPTSAGGHLAVYEAVRAQLDPPMELSAADVREDVPKVQAILDLAVGVPDGMSPF